MLNMYRRTVEDSKAMLAHAKQNENEVNPVTQVFYYPLQFECNETKENWRLMDLDEKFIQKLEEGERLVFKGNDQEKVVLCTETETFEVKEGEISNSLVLCPDLLYNSDLKSLNNTERVLKEQRICGVYHNYLELRLTFPRLNKLRKLLASTAYRGPEDESANIGYYFSELLENIQCSRNELIAHLKEIKAFCHEDKWRVLDLEYETRAISYIISLMEEQKWTEIHARESKNILKPLLPEFVVNHILNYFASPSEEDSNLYIFKEDKVSLSFAEMLLRTAEGRFRHNEFMMAWEQCLPPGIKPQLNHLRGLALVEKEGGLQQEVIHLFPEYSLPENISERFRLLFKRKEKWTLDEITPYIEKLATKSMNVNTMLTKYARVSNLKGIRVFGARYAS